MRQQLPTNTPRTTSFYSVLFAIFLSSSAHADCDQQQRAHLSAAGLSVSQIDNLCANMTPLIHAVATAYVDRDRITSFLNAHLTTNVSSDAFTGRLHDFSYCTANPDHSGALVLFEATPNTATQGATQQTSVLSTSKSLPDIYKLCGVSPVDISTVYGYSFVKQTDWRVSLTSIHIWGGSLADEITVPDQLLESYHNNASVLNVGTEQVQLLHDVSLYFNDDKLVISFVKSSDRYSNSQVVQSTQLPGPASDRPITLVVPITAVQDILSLSHDGGAFPIAPDNGLLQGAKVADLEFSSKGGKILLSGTLVVTANENVAGTYSVTLAASGHPLKYDDATIALKTLDCEAKQDFISAAKCAVAKAAIPPILSTARAALLSRFKGVQTIPPKESQKVTYTLGSRDITISGTTYDEWSDDANIYLSGDYSMKLKTQ